MHPAFSVVFLTTLIGVGQGLFLALYLAEVYTLARSLPALPTAFYVVGSVLSVGFLVAGLGASFFHLGHPERAWRSAAKWRTSWLSREVVALPATMGMVSLYAIAHFLGAGTSTLIIGLFGVFATFALFLCTGMIYACIRFLQEWASPLTVINYTLLGCASGFTLGTAYAAYAAPALVGLYLTWAIALTLIALATRTASLVRNASLRPKSTLQTAIGVRHSGVAQKSQGFMGGSFNTREFFHGASHQMLKSIKWVFMLLVFAVPIVLLLIGQAMNAPTLLMLAFLVQYIGLIAERWYFFAQANHPQNIYYQTVG